MNLEALDLSENNFTGSIPSEIFSLTKLTHLAVGQNCLDVALVLTDNVCYATTLQVLFINGLHTSSDCRTDRFFREPVYVNKTSYYWPLTYLLSDPANFAVPPCIFSSLQNLSTLYLSGNALTGNLNFLTALPPKLIDLVMAHNYITGDIPSVIQSRSSWNHLDLSFNKFTGTLSPKFEFINNSAYLSLQVNR
jgi:Leucine-rich repeat (LRR) protein